MKSSKKDNVKMRDERIADQASTKIWQEIPSAENPYMAEEVRCHGYDILELSAKRSFVDVLFLLFRGELPSPQDARLLERLMLVLINPGPRHPATRAAMYAGASRAKPVHLLPIALTVFGGEFLGAGEVEPCMHFLRNQRRRSAHVVAKELVEAQIRPAKGDWHIIPGFGSHYGGVEPITHKQAGQMVALPGEHRTLRWAHEFAQCLHEYEMGWLPAGLAAAVLTDLGFDPRAATGLFQLFAAPGLLAHGAEMATKKTHDMPFIKDKDYVIRYK